MSLYKFQNYSPQIGSDCFIAPNAIIIGNVIMGDNVGVWFGTVIRGDVEKVTIGANTNIQDLSMLHVAEGYSLTIGKNVTIGHKAIVHACTVGDNTLIGMGSTILDGAKIGKNSVVAAGAVVPPGKTYPDNCLIIGSPAKVKRNLSLEEKEQYGNHFKGYVDLKNIYLNKEIFSEIKL